MRRRRFGFRRPSRLTAWVTGSEADGTTFESVGAATTVSWRLLGAGDTQTGAGAFALMNVNRWTVLRTHMVVRIKSTRDADVDGVDDITPYSFAVVKTNTQAGMVSNPLDPSNPEDYARPEVLYNTHGMLGAFPSVAAGAAGGGLPCPWTAIHTVDIKAKRVMLPGDSLLFCVKGVNALLVNCNWRVLVAKAV